MSDAPKPFGGFNFGAANTSNAGASGTVPASGGLFGAKPGGLFSGAGTGSTTGGNLFGNFGSTSNTTAPATNAGAGSGSTPAPAPTNNLFSSFKLPPANPALGTTTATTGTLGAPASKPNTFNFGGSNTATTTTAPASGTQPATGTSASMPNFFSNTRTTTAAPPAGGGIFGGGGGSLFNPPDASSTGSTTVAPTPTSTTAAPAPFSGFGGFGLKQDDKPKDTAPAPTSSLFNLSAPANKDASATTPTTAAPNSGFSLLKPLTTTTAPATTDKKDTPIATTPASKEGDKTGSSLPSFSLTAPGTTGGTSSTAQNPLTTSALAPTSATSAIAVPPPSLLRGKTIEEIVNKWSSDLETHVREFNRLAGEMAVWDKALIDNGNTIAALYQHVTIAEREQNDVEQSLAHVEQQQKELAATLDVYEKSAQELFDGQSGSLRALDVGPADAERDKNYTLAAELNGQLDDLSRALTQMIDSVNTISEHSQVGDGSESKADDPLKQISQILSSHLDSLQWIEGAVREVEGKVTDVEKRVRESYPTPQSNTGSGSGFGGNSTMRSRGFGFDR